MQNHSPILSFVEGEYDLNQDGKPDKINVMLQGFVGEDGEEVQTYIEVNGIKQDFICLILPMVKSG